MIYLILSVINVILLIIITFSSVCLSFARNENSSVATVRHIIINPLQTLFFARTTFSTFNALIEVKDYKKLFCYILVLGSFFIFLFFVLEEKYVDSKEPERTVYIVATLVFFNSCCFLLLGSLFRKKKIHGLFGGFIVTSIISVCTALSLTKNHKKINLKEQGMKCSENALYFQLNLILHSIQDKDHNREEMMNFIKFDEFSINEGDNFWKEQKKEYLLLLKVESMFKKLLNEHQNSLILKVGMFKLLYYYLKKFKAAYILIYNLYEDICEKNIHASIGEKFYVFRIKKNLEEKGFDSIFDKTEISTRYQINRFRDKIAKAAESYYSFWTLLLNASQNKDIQKLNKMGFQIGKIVHDIKYQFEKITTMKLKDKKVYALYGYYLRDILNERGYNDDLNEILKGFSEDFSNIFNGVNLNDIHTSSNFHFMLISAYSHKFGRIEKISSEIAKILRYESEELIGHQIDMLLPNFLISEHDKYLKNYFEENTNSTYNFLKKKAFNLKSKEFFLETIYLNITVYSDEDSFPFIFAQMDEKEQMIISKNYSNSCYILTDESLIIKHFTSNAIQLLKLQSNVLDDFTEITPYIKEFNEDIHCLISQNNFENPLNDINSIKRNVIKDKFINCKEERVVSWSNNNQYFKLRVEEIIINKLLMGYNFRFQKTNSKNQRASILHKGRNSIMSLNKLEAGEKDENNNNNNTELADFISNSYIPNNKEKFEFDMNKKEFLIFNPNKQYKESFINPENYFQKYYLDIQNKVSYLNEEEEREDDFEEEDEEIDSSDINNNHSFKEIKEENSILKVSTKKSILNSPSIKKKTSNYSYYNINLQHITFYVYNFKNFVVDECKNYINECKVEQIFRNERFITSSNETKTNNEKDYKTNKKESIKNMENNQNENKKSNKKRKQFNVKKHISKNIIGLMGIIFLNLFGIVLFIIIVFYEILTSHKEISRLIEIQNSLADLKNNSNNAFFYTYLLIALQKSIYFNYNPSKKELEENYYFHLKVIYEKILELENSITSFYSSMESGNQKKLDHYNIQYCSLTSTNNSLNCTNGYIFNLLGEFAFNVFSFYSYNINELNFTNSYFNFIFANYELLLLEGLEGFELIFIDEYELRINNLEKILIIIIISLVILEIIILLGFIQVNINVKKEEVKIFEIFFKINPQYIINAINKCEKFIEVNHVMQDNANNLVSNPVINVLKDSNDEETINLSETSSLMSTSLNQKVKNFDNRANKMKLIEKKIIEYDFLIKFLFLFIIVLIVFIIINTYARKEFKAISRLVSLYLKVLRQQSYFVKLFNYYRTYLIFSYHRKTNEKIKKIYILLHNELSLAYEKNQDFYIEIMTLSYSLGENERELFKSYYNDEICVYFEDYGKSYNKSCDEVADNIGKYGLWFSFNHAIQLLTFLVKRIDSIIEEGESNGYFYDEINYDSGIINPLYPSNPSLYDDYLKYNPFNIINSNTTLNLTVLVENIIKPATNELRANIAKIMIKYCDQIEEYSIICCIFLCFILIGYYIFLFIPKIMKTNSQIKQGKAMLKIIPKEERDKIKKSLKKEH